MKKKVFNTQKNIRWKIIDIIVFIGIFIYSSSSLVTDGFGWASTYVNSNNLGIWIVWTLILLILILIKFIPLSIIYLGCRYAIKKYNIANTTFKADSDIEYYRNTFKDISPAIISLLMDLGLETTKDLGAMKLYYELNDIYLYVRDGSIHLNNPNKVKLNKSDDILLKYFFDNKKNVFVLNEWKENVICEAINNNLISRKNNNEKKKIGCGIFLFIHLLALSFIIYYCTDIYHHVEVLNGIINYSSSDLDALNFVVSNSDYAFSLVMSFLLVISLLVYFWSAVAGIINLFIGSIISVKDRIKRTKEGNILTEKLYGMKNFIRDFSNLDEATKKHLILWKDFLIYAVVLEENDDILKEISNTYNTNLFDYKNYK